MPRIRARSTTSYLSKKYTYPLSYTHPFKALYITIRFFALFIHLPIWVVRYTISKPVKSWSLKECIMTRVIRWFMPLNATTGIHPLSIDKTKAVEEGTLKESSFLWVPPVQRGLLRGYAVDDKVNPVQVPGFLWPKGASLDAIKNEKGLVGLFFHGGGYMMGNGTESYGELEIVRQLQRNSKMKYILSVDYRLVHESAHPGQLIDAISGYQFLIDSGIEPSRIVVIGACAGGHLTMMLARYLYDHNLPMPIGLMVYSPMVDMAIDFKIHERTEAKRPNTKIDLLATSHYAVLRLLGHNPVSLVESTLFSPNNAAEGAYKSYPPTFISIGACEAFRKECEELAEVMKRDGVSVTLDTQEDAVHDFWGMGEASVPCEEARKRVQVGSVEFVGRL